MTAGALAADPPVLVELRCPQCGRVVLEYVPPLRGLKIRCRRCGYWIEVADTDAVA